MRDLSPANLDVSRETLERLYEFEHLVRSWSTRINLVSSADLENLWQRHILDSAQLVGLAPDTARWLDLGSGAGFPGIVVAILLQPQSGHVTLVESDQRKCVFLQTAARKLHLDITILSQRIEELESSSATTLSARALAPLVRLVGHAHTRMSVDGMALFPKGRNWRNELQDAKDKWSFDCDVVQSVTDKDAAILKLRNIRRI